MDITLKLKMVSKVTWDITFGFSSSRLKVEIALHGVLKEITNSRVFLLGIEMLTSSYEKYEHTSIS